MKFNYFCIKAFQVGVLGCASSVALSFASCQIPAYHAEYVFQGAVTGTIQQNLSPTASGYQFTSFTQAHKYFFSEVLNEQVTGQIVPNNPALLPIRYVNKSNHIQIDFDRKANTITISHNHLKDFSMPLAPYALDTLTMPLQLQSDVMQGPMQKSFPIQVVMLTQKQQAELLPLVFENLGSTPVSTPAGEFASIELQTTYMLNQHQIQTEYWFAPKFEDALVKSATQIDGKPIATASLSDYQASEVCVLK